MFKNLLLTLFILISGLTSPASSLDVEITSPTEGQVLREKTEIIGTAAGDGFVSAELAYAYADTDNPSWFVISEITNPVNIATLAVWDTTAISDGDYQLRLSVFYSDGTSEDFIVDHLLVRNYTEVEITATSEPMTVIATLAPTVTSVPIQATPYPENRAALSEDTVKRNLKIGALLGILLIVLLGLYSFARSAKRRR